MSGLTDTQEKAYSRKIIGLLAEYKDAMKANDVDPSSRITNLTNGAESTDKAEAAVVKADEAAAEALALANKLRADNYTLAQASVGLIEGALGKNSAAAQKARALRGEMSNPSARGPRTPEPATPAVAGAK